MVIAVDFDGTIVEHKFPAIGKEIPNAIDTLKKLSSQGHRLILFTSRDGETLGQAVQWCKDRGLTFYAVNSNYPPGSLFAERKDGASKVMADVYIDDRNIGGLPPWSDIYDAIQGKSRSKSPQKRKRSIFRKIFRK